MEIRFIFLFVTSIACKDLELCKDVEDEILCKLNEDYRLDYPPDPWPAKIQPVVRINEVIEVNENKQSLTILMKVIQEWIDPTLNVKNPQNIWYKVPKSAKLERYDFWFPILYFNKVLSIQKVSTLGKDKIHDFWFKAAEKRLWYSEDLEVTFACEMKFSDFPIDKHICNFTFGDNEMTKSRIEYNRSVVEHDFKNISNYNEPLHIKDSTTPFNFKISLIKPFYGKSVGYIEPFSFTGMTIEMKRKG